MNNLCPKCGKVLDEDNYCDSCLVEITVYNKIKMKSKALYNIGLQKAKVRNLSGAVEVLNRSVRLDRNNTDARNLLGLVYFELGETVLALRQWVISKNILEKDNEASHFINAIQNNQTYLDKLNTAIKKYNQSLHYIEQQSVDLAIIQLKRVITINPKFVQAYGLLALCYVKENQVEKAKKILRKMLKVDQNNYIGRKYLAELSDGSNDKEIDKEEAVKENNTFTGSMFSGKKINMGNNTVFQFMAMSIGVVIGLAVILFLVMPSKMQDKQQIIEDGERRIASLELEKKQLTDEFTKTKSQLEKQDADNILKTDSNVKLEDELEEVSKVVSALELYVADDLTGAADGLYLVDGEKLSGDVKMVYTNLIESIYPVVSLDAWEKGYNKYRNRAYEEGIELLETAYKYEKNAYFSDETLYFMARCYDKLGDDDKALTIYKKMIEEYPEATKKGDAEYFIGKITG